MKVIIFIIVIITISELISSSPKVFSKDELAP